MSEPIVYLNSGFLPASQVKLNIYDPGTKLLFQRDQVLQQP